MAETITAAAIQFLGKVWSLPPPTRHHHLLHSMQEILGRHEDGSTGKNYAWPLPLSATYNEVPLQGFVTSEGRFVTRIEAAEIALAAGQIPQLTHPPNLYSEDLW